MRPLSERIRDPLWWLDQVLHTALGGAIGYAFSDLTTMGAIAFSTALGVFRELIQNLRRDGWHGSKADAAVDVAAWVLGAIIGSLIA